MRPSPHKSVFFFPLLFLVPSVRAGELSLQILPQARVEYEGTGYREVPNGWELKVKPWSSAGGVRWRTELSPTWGFQMQYLKNNPAYFAECGNSVVSQTEAAGERRSLHLKAPNDHEPRYPNTNFHYHTYLALHHHAAMLLCPVVCST